MCGIASDHLIVVVVVLLLCGCCVVVVFVFYLCMPIFVARHDEDLNAMGYMVGEETKGQRNRGATGSSPTYQKDNTVHQGKDKKEDHPEHPEHAEHPEHPKHSEHSEQHAHTTPRSSAMQTYVGFVRQLVNDTHMCTPHHNYTFGIDFNRFKTYAELYRIATRVQFKGVVGVRGGQEDRAAREAACNVVVVHVGGPCRWHLWDSFNATCGTLSILLLWDSFNTTHLVVFYVPFFGSDCFDVFTSLTNTHCCLMPRYCPGRRATTGGGGGQQQQQRRDDDDQYVHSFQVGTVRIQCSCGHQIG